MNHCVLISAYKDARLINRLISRIPETWGIYIHLDKLSDIKNEDISDRAVCIPRRNVRWGSFAHVEAFLDMMRLALKDDRKFDYFHLITGQDYPIINLMHADRLIEQGKIYMLHQHIPAEWWKNCWDGGFHFYKYWTFARWIDIRRPIYNKILNRLSKIAQFWKPKGLYMPPYPAHGGSSYMSLPREAVKLLVDSEISRDLQKRLKYKFVRRGNFLPNRFDELTIS